MVYEIICPRKDKEKRKLKGSILIKKQANEASKITRERPAKKDDVVKQVAHLWEERLWLILPARFMVGSIWMLICMWENLLILVRRLMPL